MRVYTDYIEYIYTYILLIFTALYVTFVYILPPTHSTAPLTYTHPMLQRPAPAVWSLRSPCGGVPEEGAEHGGARGHDGGQERHQAVHYRYVYVHVCSII